MLVQHNIIEFTGTKNSTVTFNDSFNSTIPISTFQPTVTPTITATPIPTVAARFKDGTYTGSNVDAYYGYVQVQAVIQNGVLIDVVFLSYPNDRSHSVELSNYAMPILKSEAIQAQNSQVNIVSGATATSQGFQESLGAALTQAAN